LFESALLPVLFKTEAENKSRKDVIACSQATFAYNKSYTKIDFYQHLGGSMSENRYFKITGGPVNVRSSANGATTGRALQTGQIVEVVPDSRQEKGGYIWWKHGLGWSAEKDTEGNTVFMVDIAQIDTAESLFFKITSGPVLIRDAANGSSIGKSLQTGQVIEVKPGSRQEAGGYIWWEHNFGWSVEKSADDSTIFMEQMLAADATETAATTMDAATTAATSAGGTAGMGNRNPDMNPEDAPPPGSVDAINVQKAAIATEDVPDTPRPDLKGTVEWQASDNVKIRESPSTKRVVPVSGTLVAGEIVRCNMDHVVIADGYYWLEHEKGWSAWQAIDGDPVFLVEPGTVPGLLVIGPDGPALEDLPGYKTMVSRAPVDVAQTAWFQYYGNNNFAYIYGKAFNYDGYSQGLHGGLDYGNSNQGGIPIYAGLHGEVFKIDYKAGSNNNKVWVRANDYIIIYQHVINIRVGSGTAVEPNTIVADIHFNMPYDPKVALNHLHFEVRFRRDWIINPLALMSDAMVKNITDKFKPDTARTPNNTSPSTMKYFFKSDSWSQWVTPFDQPVIRRGGPLIGPRAK